MKFEETQLEWIVRPESVIVRSESATEDCGEHAARALEQLPLTPYRAVGNNFSYEGGLELAALSKNLQKAFWLHTLSREGTARSDVGGSLKRNGAVYNVNLSLAEEGILRFGVNVHRIVEGNESKAWEYARMFKEDQEQSIELSRDLFGIEVQND